MSIKAVIFDIGGVLLQNAESDGSNSPQWESRLGLQKGDIFKFINRSGLSDAATRGKISSEEVWQRVSAHFKLDLEQLYAAQAEYQAGETLNTELAEFLTGLRSRYKTALLSNAWPGAREALNRKYGLDKLADMILFSAEEGTLKPDAKFYLMVLHRLGVQAYETIFVDDKIINVDGAYLVGMHSILYKDNAQTLAAINKYIEKHA